MQVDFYHLTATTLDRVLPQIAEKVLAGGQRLVVVAGDDERRRQIDRLLWTAAPDSFLPHGCEGDGDAARQPILIAADVGTANGARHVALVDCRWRDAVLDFDRAFHIFDDQAIDAARLAWKGLAGRHGVERRYWKQGEGGRWERAA